MNIKILSIITLLCFFMLNDSHAQNGNKNRPIADRVQAQMVAYLTNELALTPQEAEKFWPLYNEYKSKEREARKKARTSKPVGQMTEAEASAFINNSLESESQELELKKIYTKEFRKILPAVKVAKLQMAERGFKKELIKKISDRNN